MNGQTRLPHDIGAIHFTGIGGIGMSGIAEVLLNHGFEVQGSDAKASPITERLAQKGAKIFIGQKAENLEGARVVVISTAIKPGNPELDEARRQKLPVVRRAEMLAELMRLKSNVAIAGTHGKTTTTSMVAALLDAGGIDPTVINGGIIHAYGSNARMGDGDWMVVEADESDGTFTKLPATIAIVTNIDPEHMEHWGSIEKLRDGFYEFVSRIPFYGLAVLCTDHPEVQALVGRLTDRRIRTFGFNAQADVRAVNLRFEEGRNCFDIQLQGEGPGAMIEGCTLPMPGNHNVSNALAAVAVARHLGMKKDEIRTALANFAGVNRRFTKVGEVLGGVTIIDDYGHHPVEIAAVLKAARQAVSATPGARVIAAHQPHRYTRLANLFEDFCTCFNEADVVAIADVYAAGEEPIPGASRDDLVSGLIRHGHRHARALISEDDLARLVKEQARPGDIVVCLGAGTISTWANGLPAKLG
jgi:UDP-N-acetylmuramate--alanine ligase